MEDKKSHSDILRKQQIEWHKKYKAKGTEYFIGQSHNQEGDIVASLEIVLKNIKTKFPNIKLKWEKKVYLKDIIKKLKIEFPKEEWHYKFDASFMCPDGGMLYLVDKNKNYLNYPILIGEVKHQGTNDKLIAEGKKKQALGNAIERLGKNVIGFRTWMLNETIFPFVCFGYGYDFNPTSSIQDRVITIAEFGELNKTHLHNSQKLNRGSFYFREKIWTIQEMANIMTDIAIQSIHYYFSKYKETNF